MIECSRSDSDYTHFTPTLLLCIYEISETVQLKHN